MVKVKSIEETVARYAESAVPSAVRLKRYWMSRGYSEKTAMDKATSQALGMLRASVEPRKALELLKETEEMAISLKEKIAPDCMHCPFMPSLDLYRTDEVRKDAGGELYILGSLVNEPQALAIYHNTGGLIGSLEEILVDCQELIETMTCIHMFMWHSIRDLKASAFLAFSGRYRQALMVLRSALELIFAGIYFQELNDCNGEEKLNNEWVKWWKGKKTDVFSKGKIYAVKKGFLTKEAGEIAGQLYGELSKAVHGLIRDEFEEIDRKDKKPARPASAFYDIEFLKDWFKYLLQIVTIVQYVARSLSPQLSERGKKGLKLLENITRALQVNEQEALPFVDCPRLHYRLANKEESHKAKVGED
jgi:hypothetical protein